MTSIPGKMLAATALVAAAFATPAHAIPLELALVIDGSGSITAAEFGSQKTSYVNALTDVLPRDGSVAIGVWQFSTTVQSVFATAVITSANFASLVSSINGMSQLAGNTAIGDAITTARTALLGNAIVSDRQVIDVSTDGFNNVGVTPDSAATAAIAAGIEQVNCIGIGADADCGFIAGAGAFTVNALNFAAFEAGLRTKLTREIVGTVPEPETYALLALGLGMFAIAARRRRVTQA